METLRTNQIYPSSVYHLALEMLPEYYECGDPPKSHTHWNNRESGIFFDQIFIKAMMFGQRISSGEGAYNSCWAATSLKGEKLVFGSLY